VSSYHYRDPAAPEPNKPRQVGVVAIIEHQGAVLFDRRADAEYWGLIGGHLEDDESLVEGLLREVYEEAGLAVQSYSLFGTFSDPSRRVRYADGSVYSLVSVVFRVEVADTSNLRLSEESRGFRFFTPECFPPDVIATVRPILDRYLSGNSPPFTD
jgi:8-oxo-dGTP pyrophosphatase MutT (NUDIX family)